MFATIVGRLPQVIQQVFPVLGRQNLRIDFGERPGQFWYSGAPTVSQKECVMLLILQISEKIMSASRVVWMKRLGQIGRLEFLDRHSLGLDEKPIE
jgi:hypothetical protein